ncbi:sigma-54-dependent Fis family transcriptional regulator [bacterium]|jgi:two-component system, NtrC family, response regulator AtoC|nr:sigma-54-dependent Fis family transcriptional regulator [bacterium]
MGKYSESPNILLIDDEESILASVIGVLSADDYQVTGALNGKLGLKHFSQSPPSLVIVDYKMPEMNGIEFIKAAKSIAPEVPIIVMTAHGDKDLSIQFIKEGAYRYIEKPFDLEEFKLTVKDAIDHSALINENKKLQRLLKIDDDFPEIIGDSPVIQSLFALINKVAQTDVTILIEGESGTGKELIAKAIHEKSNLAKGPFIRFNCAALPENLIESELFGHEKGAFTGADQRKLGRFELAHNGTIFLDEIGELSLSMQVKLLRVLQEKEFERIGGTKTIKTNVRILAATNRDLKQMVKDKTFREDLFYRLSVFPIEIPPLRDRGSDVLLIADYFLKRFGSRYGNAIKGFSEDAKQRLTHYEWRGNVRELENVISRATILCAGNEIESDHLPINISEDHQLIDSALDQKMTERDLCKSYARRVYDKCSRNKKDTASFLGVNFRTLQSRLEE